MSVEKIEYKREYFDLFRMRGGARVTTVINKDGGIVSKKYNAGSRKITSIQKAVCSLEEFEQLCNEIELCINNADSLDFYIDDASSELKIFYKCGRIQIVDRGLGYDNFRIGKIVNKFLSKYLNT